MRTVKPLYFLCQSISFLAILVSSTLANITSPNPLPEFTCVTLPSWTDHRFSQTSCRLAFDYAKNVESFQVRTYFEFLPANVASITGVPRMDTPRRYRVGELYHRRLASQVLEDGAVALMLLAIPGPCTVAVVMLEFFQELPGQPPTRARRMRDITRFYDIFSQGQFVIENCVRYGRAPSPGWMNAGKEPARPKRFRNLY